MKLTKEIRESEFLRWKTRFACPVGLSDTEETVYLSGNKVYSAHFPP